jgi:hypothetical protein
MDAGTIAAVGSALVGVAAVITAVVNGVATLRRQRRDNERDEPQNDDDDVRKATA